MMMGTIIQYNEKDENGYIQGFDECNYFFKLRDIKGKTPLKEGTFVEFEYYLNVSDAQMPHAIAIQEAKMPSKEKSVKEANKAKVYKELYEIIMLLPEEEKQKIPNKFMEELKSKKDSNYFYKIEHFKDFENQKMLHGTKVLLALVYRDFLTSKEEKKIISDEKISLNHHKETAIQKADDIFHKDSDIQLTPVEEKSLFQRFILYLKKLFK